MNGKEFISDLEFESLIKEMDDRELQEFTARQVYEVCSTVASHGKRLFAVERKGNRVIGAAGATGAFIGGGLIAIINYFTGR